jgi:diguanylate cyclase (GGDEF)-like protein
MARSNVALPPGPARRERVLTRRLTRRITGLDFRAMTRPGYEIGFGRALLVVTGVVVTIPMPLLHLSGHDLTVFLRLSATMTAVFLVSVLLPWHRLPRQAVIAFPLSVMTALACLGLATGPAIGSSFTGLFVLCFAYVGVCCPPRAVAWLLPVALPAYVATVDTWNATVAIRLVIASCVWTVLAELLAHLLAQQRVIVSALEKASRTDSLTQLANRRDFDGRLSDIALGDTVVICDLDNFKLVNDTFGHAQGDMVLQDFGRILNGALRGDDYAARYGGEEFVLFLSDTDAAQTRDVLIRLHRRWARVQPDVTFSAGYATYGSGMTPMQALEAADQALYMAKESGRNRDCDALEIGHPLITR